MRFYIIKILEEREETIKEIIQENFPHALKKASSEKKMNISIITAPQI